MISICRLESGTAAGWLTGGEEGRAARKVFDEGFCKECFSCERRFFAERSCRAGEFFCSFSGDDASAVRTGVTSCDVCINASGGSASEKRTPAGGGGTASRARTERIAGTLNATKRHAAAAIKISCGRVGLDHHGLFLILAVAACELARASGYRADASSSQEAKRSAGFFERQRATMRSSAAGTAGLCRDGGSGAACKICAQTAAMELPSKGRAPVNI